MAVTQAVTNISLVRNTGTICTGTAIADDTTTIVITPTQGCERLIFILTSTGATGFDVDVAAGDYWAGTAMTTVAITQNVPRAFIFESARHKAYVSGSSQDTITITVGANATTTVAFQCLELP